jgi:hypothetical protein
MKRTLSKLRSLILRAKAALVRRPPAHWANRLGPKPHLAGDPTLSWANAVASWKASALNTSPAYRSGRSHLAEHGVASSKPPVSIKALLDSQGTDKGRILGGLYGVMLQPAREYFRCVVEIGIGTMIPGVPSSMVGFGADSYRPGASLRAWRDFFPNAAVHGIDVAADTQIDGEARITTHLCDSSNADHAATVLKAIAPLIPDLIIDDGLHSASAQIATLRNFFPALRAAGLYVVEDVIPSDVPTILSEIERIDPGCDFFVPKQMGDECFAIVIRKT